LAGIPQASARHARRSAAVLGGGIAGCTLAAELAKSGRVDVTLLERAPALGGLHRSEQVGPYVFDIGAFVFVDNHAIFSVFPALREAFPEVSNRYGSVRTGGVLDDYPMTIGGVRRQLGNLALARIAAEILAAKITRFRRDSVPSFAEYYIGPTLYRFSGLKTYIERLYLAPDSTIDLEFATKRMAVVARSGGLRRNAMRLARGLASGRWAREAFRPITAPRVRVRPAAGFPVAYRAIGASLGELGVAVRCGTTLTAIERDADGFTLVTDKGRERFDQVFSTIPLEVAARLLGMEGFELPEYVDLYSLFFELAGEPAFPHNVLHNFTDTGRWKRLTVFSRYYGPLDGKHYLAVEGTARQHASEETTLRDGTADFEDWMRRHGLLPGELRYLGGVVTRRAYPVYRRSAARGVEQLKDDLRRRGLLLAGRQGSFDYVTSSDAAGDALAVARAFLAAP